MFSEPFFLIVCQQGIGLKITNIKSDVAGCSDYVQILRIEKKKFSEAFTVPSTPSLLPPRTLNTVSLFSIPAALIHSDFMFKLGKCSPLFLVF